MKLLFLTPAFALCAQLIFSNTVLAQGSSIDTNLKTQAQNACHSSSAKDFINAISFSRTLANQYVAPSVKIIKYKAKQKAIAFKTKAQYRFPIMIWDNFFALTDSENKTGRPTYLKIEINQSQNNRIVVDFYPVSYQSLSEGYEGQPDKIGPSQQLLFIPKNQCWQLIEHTIYEN